MNNVLSLLRIPLVKFVGAVVILYFALFSNKHDPESLRNRLSKERISQNLHDVQEKGRFIVSNVKTAQNLSRENNPYQNIENKISIKEVKIGDGDKEVSCGNEVEISYQIFVDDGSQIKNVSLEKIIVGSNIHEIIEQNIVNMKQGGIKIIDIPKGFNSNDSTINALLKSYNSGIRYQIHLLSLKSNSDTKLSCK